MLALAAAAGAAVAITAAIGHDDLGVAVGCGVTVAAGGSLLLLELRVRRRFERRARLAVAELAALDALIDPGLAHRSSSEALAELLERLRGLLDAQAAVLLVLTYDRTHLTVRGHTDKLHQSEDLPAGEGILGRIATGNVVVVDDVGPDDALPAGLVEGARSLAGCPLYLEGREAGVLLVVSSRPRQFTNDDLDTIQVAADRASLEVELMRLRESERRATLSADHAWRHLALMAETVEVLAPTLQVAEPALAQLVDVFVPAFADWCSVEIVTGEGEAMSHVAAAHSSPDFNQHLTALMRRHPDAATPIKRVMATGRSILEFDVAAPRHAVHPDDDEFLAMARELEMVSCMIVPIRRGGLSLGAMTFGTGARRRGFRPSDLRTAEQLAERTAVALERVLLYQQTEEAARQAERHAEQLERLVSAALAIDKELLRGGDATGSVERVLHIVADESRRATRAAEAAAVAEGDVPTPPPEPTLAVPIRSREGEREGTLAVWGGREFTHDDESILVLLAEMAATAVDTARLYELAQTRGERLRAVLNASPLAIVELDDAGEATRWNDAALATFGWRPGDGDGHERRVFHETTASRFAPLVESARDGRPSLNVELTALRSDGNEVELSVSTAPLRAADRSVAGVLVVAADITDRRHLELQLHQAQRMEAMGRLAGGVAHDFNNMLTVILGYSEFLLRQLPEGAPMRAEIESIKSAGDRAARLTEQLLTISRRRVVQPIVVDVNDAVRSIEALLRRLIGEDVHLRTELDPDAGRVRIDPGQLDQVILNLVINARDAMPTGGDLVIETAAADEDGPGVVISIVDTGVGMDEQALEHCFEPFFSTKDRGKGTGLGLSTVYGIVTQAGGTVVAESTPGQGTAIRIFLPRVDEEVEAEGTAAPTPVYQHVGTVLLAEDEPQVRAIACEVLAGAGYSVVEAPDGLAALELARSGDVAFDVLVTDVVMPGMHGADLAAAIVDLQPETGVLFISGYADQGIGGWRRGDARGKFLAKPFQPDDLVRSVHELMEERRPQGSKR